MDIHFYKQFKEVIEKGIKVQTIREKRLRCAVGDKVNLVVFPYSPKREVIRQVTLFSIAPIEIDGEKKTIMINDRLLNREGINQFAKNEGFETIDRFWWYINNHQCSGKAYLYKWAFFSYRPYFKPLIVDYQDINKK